MIMRCGLGDGNNSESHLFDKTNLNYFLIFSQTHVNWSAVFRKRHVLVTSAACHYRISITIVKVDANSGYSPIILYPPTRPNLPRLEISWQYDRGGIADLRGSPPLPY